MKGVDGDRVLGDGNLVELGYKAEQSEDAASTERINGLVDLAYG